MNNNAPYVATVTYWNDVEEPWVKKTESVLIYAENFTDAMDQVIHYYALIEDVHIYEIGQNGDLCILTPEMLEYFISGKACGYNDEN